MTNINQIAKELASKIVFQLNQKDSNPNDNFIDANIWKQYAVANYGVKDNGNIKISVFQAEKSIEKCLNTQSIVKDKSISEIGNQWYGDLVNIGEQSIQNYFADYKSHTEKNDATKNAAVNIPEAKTIQKSERPTLTETLNIKIRTFEECKESAKLHIKQELNRRNLTKTDKEIEYWSEKIGFMAYKYDIPEEILVSIIGRENKFSKNSGNGNGNGAMALTTIAIKDMFPNSHWAKAYAMLDEDLYRDIFYKDSKLQYRDSVSVRKACKKDDISMKTGTLYFEMCYVKALTAEIYHKKYEKVTVPELQDTITKMKAGQIDFSKINNENVVAKALLQYNGHPAHMKGYREDTMDSLRVQGFNFQEQIIVKKTKV